MADHIGSTGFRVHQYRERTGCGCWNCEPGCSCSCFLCVAVEKERGVQRERFEIEDDRDPVWFCVTTVCFKCREVSKKRITCPYWGNYLIAENPGTLIKTTAEEKPKNKETRGEREEREKEKKEREEARKRGYFLKCACGEKMGVVGPAFRCPPKSNKKEWERMTKIILAGYCFSPCECHEQQNKNALKKLGVSCLEEVK